MNDKLTELLKKKHDLDEKEEEIYDAEITAECKKMQEAIAYVKENIDYPFERIENYLENNERDYHIGYVRVESLFESFGIPKYKIISEEKSYPLLSRQDDNSEDTFHCLVYQETIFEDCFSGYLLFPLKDGRYWMISYEC